MQNLLKEDNKNWKFDNNFCHLPLLLYFSWYQKMYVESKTSCSFKILP